MTKAKTVKCLVWDLDNTLWDGTLLEGDACPPRPAAIDLLRVLDERGILHSIASRNDRDAAGARLAALGLDDYFLCPEIDWGAKSASLRRIAAQLNIGLDALAFVDDEPFERAEVAAECPEVLVLDAADLASIGERSEMRPRFVTDESRRRRHLYRAEEVRTAAEQSFAGPSEAFLAGLNMKLRFAPASAADLARCEELTVRTNQLNTTGRPYSYDELERFSRSQEHKLLVAELDDRFGSYGKIGLALVECRPDAWTIKLLLMSCRVMSRGVGTILINHLRDEARRAGVDLLAEFVPNDRNRMMYVTFKFNGFREVSDCDGAKLMRNDLTELRRMPEYVELIAA
jgi:FkbH-like protein